ncbi:hypothetical protein ACFO0N_03170 [Halobium salinum]|uniref:PRC-barrel domain-containing protein n=1 Tax=Halobium salinum TaxID=1364940 RepID=A0ABD5P8X3_9EURY|nr:hypothetical protein [Halobium salinum]
MQRDFTGEDRDKTVEDASGNEVGTVDLIDEGRAQMSASSDMTSAIKEFLGWDAEDDEGELKREHVAGVDDETVRLRSSDEVGANDGV